SPRALRIVESFPCRRDRLVNLSRARVGDLGQHFARRRIDGVEVLLTFDPFPVDEELAGLDLYFGDRCHFAVNVAGRLSTYAARPSFASSLWKSSCWFSRSMASADSIGTSHPLCTARLMRPTALAALFGGVNWRAYSMMFSMKLSRSKMSLMMPISLASSKEKVLPTTINSMALDFPTRRERRCVPPVPGRTPRFTSGRPILPASRRATRMSAAMAIS